MCAQYSASQDHSLRIWSVSEGISERTLNTGSNCLGVCNGPSEYDLSVIRFLDFFDSFRQVVTCHYDRSVRLWDVRGRNTQADIVIPTSHTNNITSVDYRHSDGLIITSSKDHSFQLIDARNLSVVKSFR